MLRKTKVRSNRRSHDSNRLRLIIFSSQILVTANTSQLTIPEVFPEDAGNYSVLLQNLAGQACSKSRLVVEAPPEEKPYGEPPKFEQPLIHPVTVKSGEPVTFECKVSPRVIWD